MRDDDLGEFYVPQVILQTFEPEETTGLYIAANQCANPNCSDRCLTVDLVVVLGTMGAFSLRFTPANALKIAAAMTSAVERQQGIFKKDGVDER